MATSVRANQNGDGDDGEETAPSSVAVNHRKWLVAGPTIVLAALVLAVFVALDADAGPAPLLVGLILAEAVSWGSTYVLQPKGEFDLWQLDEAVFVCALIVLPPFGVLLVFAVGVLLGLLVVRQRLVNVGHNAAQMTLAAAAGIGVAHAISSFDGPIDLRLVVAALAGAAVLALANEIQMALWVRVVEGRPFWTELGEFLRFRMRRSPWIASGGVIAGAAGRLNDWILIFAVPPIAAFQLVLAEHLRARRDRERTQGLFEAATEAHASVRPIDVEQAFTEAAARLLRCGAAVVVARPPEAGEWGVQLTVGGPTARWLIVGDRHSNEPLDDDDQMLLETLAAVGSSALENARLVEEIRNQAVHDGLTGLPNQLLFDDRVDQAITQADQEGQRFAVAALDLDAFKKVNDSLGHAAGNELLKVVAARLEEAVGALDTAARLGGDNFTLLLRGVDNALAAATMAERLLAAIREPFRVAGQELYMTASIGIAFHPEDGTQPEHLLRNADAAMHRAKEVGPNGYQIYAASMNALAHLRLALESELHTAIERHELTLRYQPQVDLTTERIVGLEALVRWNHPVLGLVGPAEFIPIAEESGFITDLDLWVLEEACRQAQAWLHEGLPAVRLSVNLSGRHFTAPDRVVGSVCAVLARTGFDPASLELEVTEGVAVNESEDVIHALEELRALGVRIAIDDFGTGYSMLGRLQRFPVDRLKIDQSFVAEITSEDSSAPLVVAIVAMARGLNLETVAEGVETAEQREYLRRHGCDHAQGYFFAEPRDAAAIAQLLEPPPSTSTDVRSPS